MLKSLTNILIIKKLRKFEDKMKSRTPTLFNKPAEFFLVCYQDANKYDPQYPTIDMTQREVSQFCALVEALKKDMPILQQQSLDELTQEKLNLEKPKKYARYLFLSIKEADEDATSKAFMKRMIEIISETMNNLETRGKYLQETTLWYCNAILNMNVTYRGRMNSQVEETPRPGKF